MRRVAITGLGVVAPNGVGVETFWRNATAGVSGIRAITRFDAGAFKSRIAGLVEDEIPGDPALDRYVRFALLAADEAMAQAGLDLGSADLRRYGATIATAIGGTQEMETAFLAATDRGRGALDHTLLPASLPHSLTFNEATARVARRYGFRGPSVSMSTGCTSGLDALELAAHQIRCGRADVMVAGASEAPVTPIAMAAFEAIGALASDSNDLPVNGSRPYDASRAGFVIGEGCGVLVLEGLDHALARGATILGILAGCGTTSNAYHMTDIPDDGGDLAQAMRLALQDAGLGPEDIDHASAHGSSTKQNDIAETNAVKAVFGARAAHIPMSSLKSMTGHALAAANAIESVATVMSLITGVLHPTVNLQTPDAGCDLDYVPNVARRHPARAAIKFASGFSGIHSAAVFTRYEGSPS